MNRILLLLFLLIIFVSPVFAGPLEDALRTNNYVMLYISSPECKVCREFDPIFTKLASSHKQKCKFVKVDATTKYGKEIAIQVGAHYVPYVLMLNSSKQTMTQINPSCIMDYACINKELNSFAK